MKQQLIAIFMITFIIISCNKAENSIENSLTSNNGITKKQEQSARKSIGVATNDSIEFLNNLSSPVNEIKNFLKIGGSIPEYIAPINTQTGTEISSVIDPIDCYTPPICNGIEFPTQSGWSCDPGPPPVDAFGNYLSCWASYGTNSRQKYYVYYPTGGKNANSPIAVLIHGGGWFSGPNPETVVGCPFSFSDDPNKSLVKDLRNNGFIVVSILYRLSSYSKDNEINLNTIHWQDQINDVDAAILHVRNNFPNCIGVNANSIQVLGESAGGHLALMWSYTKANTSYIKAVTSCYAPTNINQLADYVKTKPAPLFQCGGNFRFNAPPSPPNAISDYPFFFSCDENDTYIPNSNTILNTSTISTPLCNVATINNSSNGVTSTTRILDTYNMIESPAGILTTTPLTNSTFTNYSPKEALNSTRIIPTFIMHGKDWSDWLVPYPKSTDGMQAKLTSIGGLINNAPYTWNWVFNVDLPTTIPTTYNGNSKHLIKLYEAANHAWLIFGMPTQQANLKNRVRQDIIKWFNGHK